MIGVAPAAGRQGGRGDAAVEPAAAVPAAAAYPPGAEAAGGGDRPDIPRCCVVVAVRNHDSTPSERKGWAAMATQREADEAEIRQHIDRLVAGIRAKDLEGLKRLYATDVVSFDVEPPLRHVGIAAKLNNWTKVFTLFEDVTYEVRDLTVTVGDDVAFGHGFGRLSGTLRNGTATNGMWVRGTFCFRKIDGGWLIVHDQVSVPLDIASGKGVTDLEP
ncbi:ketosteroid isomerase-like protein [Thermocatellispora tengchongensis]|uniref:Ketosteroid isomerase-like protein n=1 Tax=Thermocatellispora tengchongensis TaxID=1073253 RepID=A0A840PKK8_9ACTN|nr:nuclear transport factor 2 family protein [Thermocatellispora tengchongensis]MBB5139632.1 ketosteroid isomerase-like protein [Thermocatellispora tengchongensis]